MNPSTLKLLAQVLYAVSSIAALYIGFRVYGSSKSMWEAFGTVLLVECIACILIVTMVWYFSQSMTEEERRRMFEE